MTTILYIRQNALSLSRGWYYLRAAVPRNNLENGQAIRICVRDATRMGTQLLADVLRRDRRFRVMDLPCDLQSLTSADIQVAIVFCDPSGPNDELEAIRRVRILRPQVKIVALMDDPSRAAILKVFRAGVRGIFCRSDSYKTLAKCVARVHSGHVWASQSQLSMLVEAIGQPFPMTLTDAKGAALLSRREHDVVHWVTEGLTNREIADRMQLSEHTVKNYLFRIFDKLGVSTRAELLLYALSQAFELAENTRRSPDIKSSLLLDEDHDANFCPLTQYQLGIQHGPNGGTNGGYEEAYIRLSVAKALGATLAESSKSALHDLESLIAKDRLPELKRTADEQVQKVLEACSSSAAGPFVTRRVA